MKPLLILIVYNLFFWRHHYANPFRQSTGELLSTYFPHWRWCGQQWAAAKFPAKDRIYYQYPGCIPFLSTWYPLHMLSSLLSVRLPLNAAFALFTTMVYAHYAFGSWLAYWVFHHYGYGDAVSLFGAITLAYSGYFIKPQNPCIVYTNTWLVGALLPGWLGKVSLGMAVLGGYWPVAIYFIPIVALVNPSSLWGLLISLPQIVPFCWYWPKSIRSGCKAAWKFGAVPWWRFIDLIIPDLGRTSINGVLFTEMSMYAGILALVFAITAPISIWTGVMVGAALLSLGFAPFRIAARWLHLFTYGLTFCAVAGMSRVHSTMAVWFLLLFQACDLSRNAGLQPIWPFCEWVRKPSDHIVLLHEMVGKLNPENFRVSGLPFPFFTGYLLGWRTLGYTGGFSLKDMCEFRGITDPNGESAHDKMPDDSYSYGVKFAIADGGVYTNENCTAHTGEILEELAWIKQTSKT